MNELLIQVFDSSILDGVLTFHPLHHWSINLKVAFFFLKGQRVNISSLVSVTTIQLGLSGTKKKPIDNM